MVFGPGKTSVWNLLPPRFSSRSATASRDATRRSATDSGAEVPRTATGEEEQEEEGAVSTVPHAHSCSSSCSQEADRLRPADASSQDPTDGYWLFMARSAVLTGKFDARDRAKVRRRHDRKTRSETDAYQQIQSWLQASEIGLESDREMLRFDTDAYLAQTGHIEMRPEERLRQLAMFVESTFGSLAPDALDRVYAAAVRLNENDAVVWHSRGISAKFVALVAQAEATQKRFVRLALRYLQRAEQLAPDDASIAYALGKWHYEFGTTEDAALEFDRALQIEPDFGWAALFRAHCLHDQERWSEAAAAYSAVPLETFKGPRAWRVDIVLEALAYCRLRAGERSSALADFTRLIERLTKDPHRAEMLDLRYLHKACTGPLRSDLLGSYTKLLGRLGR